MATSSLNTLEDLVHCPVCFEEYDNPQLLKCLHVFCIHCVKKLTKSARVECPECRVKSHVTQIRKDFNKQTLVDLYHKQIDEVSKITTVREKCDDLVCENCNESKAVKWKCKECEGKFICEECKNAHRLFGATKSHCLISVEQITDEMKLRLSRSLQGLKQQKLVLKSKLNKASGFLQEVSTVKHKACDDINKYRDQLKKEIDDHHDGLIHSVDKLFQDQNISPANQEESIAEVLKEIDTKVALVEDISKTSHVKTLVENTAIVERDIAAEIENIQSKIQHLEKEKCGHIPKVVIEEPLLIKPSTLTKLKLLDSFPKPSNQASGKQEQVENPKPVAAYVIKKSVESKPEVEASSSDKTISSNTSYMKLLDENIILIKDKVIFLEKDAYRLYTNNTQIWCVESDGACVYNESLNQVDEIKHGRIESARSVQLDFNNRYIIACSGKNGLWQMENDCDHVHRITKGSYADMQLHNNLLYVLKQQTNCIAVFQFKFNCWQRHHDFQVDNADVDSFDTLYVNDNFIYISSRSNDQIYQYSHAGDLIQTYGKRGDGSPDQLKGPRLCRVDQHGNMLVADSFNHCLKVCSRSGEWHTLNVKRGISRPLDVLVDADCQRLWVLTAKQIILMKTESK